MAENPRIEELRRRVQKDPASIAFAQLAEEYRRAGHYEDAIQICRSGLQTHPSYLSARVTLGRALIEMNELETAEAELRYVLQHAAENLAAIRAMAEIHQRRGELSEALGFYKTALELARHDPDLEQTVDEISRTIAKAPSPAAPPEAAPVLTPEQRNAEFLANTFDLLDLEDLDLGLPTAETVAAAPTMPAQVMPEPPEPLAALPAVPEPILAEPVMAAAPADDLALLEDFLSQLPGVVPEPTPATPVVAAAPPEPESEPEPEQAVDTAAEFVLTEPVMTAPILESELEPEVEQPPQFEEVASFQWEDLLASPASGEEQGDAPMHMGVIVNPALPGLERFLEAIHTYRQRRAV